MAQRLHTDESKSVGWVTSRWLGIKHKHTVRADRCCHRCRRRRSRCVMSASHRWLFSRSCLILADPLLPAGVCGAAATVCSENSGNWGKGQLQVVCSVPVAVGALVSAIRSVGLSSFEPLAAIIDAQWMSPPQQSPSIDSSAHSADR